MPRAVSRVLARPSIALALVAALPLFGCGARPFAEGGSRELTVVTALPADAPEILLLRAVVERPAIAIEHEAAYEVRLADPADPRAYRARTALFVGWGPARTIPKPLKPLAELLHRAPHPFVFAPDLWLRGQATGLLWTARREDLLPALEAHQNRLFQELDRATFGTVRSRLDALPRDNVMEHRLEREAGYTLRVPRGYDARIDPRTRAALLLNEGPPTRLLRVMPAPARPAPDLMQARDALARSFRPDERTLLGNDPVLTSGELRGAVRRIHGRWEDAAVSAAGPYRFYEVVRAGKRYYVDLAVFAPGRQKLPYLRELQAIAETLATP